MVLYANGRIALASRSNSSGKHKDSEAVTQPDAIPGKKHKKVGGRMAFTVVQGLEEDPHEGDTFWKPPA